MSSLDFLSGGGVMGERIRNFDWSKTPIGPPEYWEQSLKTCVRIMLTSPQPMFVWWGKELINIYNDAYCFVLGEKDATALGVSGKIVWKEIWSDLWPRVEVVFEKNEGTFDDALLLIMNRYGYYEETYFKFSYNPIPGEQARTAGLFCVCTEETSQVINERYLSTLRELDSITQKISERQVYEQVARALSFNNKDFPFGIIYYINEQEKKAIPNAFIGIQNDQKVFPTHIDLLKPENETRNFCKAYSSKEIVVSENAGRRKNLPTGFWNVEASHFVHIPIVIPGRESPVAMLSAALNPFRKFDSNYKQFVQLIADRIGIEINNILNFEQEKKKATELAELDRAKTVFFSNISHEFRTPLTLMLGNLEEALNEPKSNPKNFERMEVTHRNAMRLLKLVNTLLDFSRIESGRQKAIYSLTDIATLTKSLLGNFRSIIEKAGLKFIVKADSIIQPVYLDKQMWEKIVFNLLSNAFKYTLKGSITVCLYTDKKNVILDVEDTGAGIPENELPHMFERFHRVENVVGRTYEGTGIGLSLTKELVALHGGTIRVKSKVGKGSTFSVAIPLGKEHLPADQTSDHLSTNFDQISNVYLEEAASLLDEVSGDENHNVSNGNGKSKTVLVVDDNSDMRQHISSLLKKRFNVMTAANGREALEKIKTQEPSIIVTDIMMPVMNGIELLKAVKEDDKYGHIPVIFLTARAGEESKIEGLHTGADDYLVKPFSSDELKARIEAQIKVREKRERALRDIYSIFNELPFAVAVFKGKELAIEFINKYNLDIWQQRKENVIGRPLFEVRPDLKSGAEQIHKEVYETGKRFEAKEIPIHLQVNGQTELRYFDAIIDPMFDEQGRIIGQLATSIEVTDKVLARKQIEESEKLLKQTQEQFQLSIAAGKIGIWHWDVKKNKLSWSKEQLEIFGVSEADFNGRSEEFFQLIVPEDKESVLQATRLDYSLKENQYDFRIRRASDGEMRWIHSRAKTYFDKNGEPEEITGINIDITNQKNAEEKIKKSEEKNRLFIEHAPVAMAMFDKEMKYVAVSRQWMKEYDLTGDIIGKRHYDLFPNILERWKEVHSRGMLGEVQKSDEDFYVKDNGTPVWLKWEVHPWYDSAGAIGGIVIFTENISERKKGEQVIKESEESYRSLIKNLSAAVYTCDKEGNIILYNEKAVEIWGREPVAGKDKWIAFHKLFVDGKLTSPDESPMALAVKQGRIIDVKEVQIEKPDGSKLTIIPHPRPLFNSEGSVTGGVNILFDITERKNVEQALQQSEERFRAMADQAPLFVWETDEHLQTTYLNNSGHDYFGVPASMKISELSWKKYIHPDDLDRVMNTMWDAVARKQSYTLEMRLMNGKTGEYHWFLDKGAPRYLNDNFIGFIGTSLDIHERKEIEEELELKVQGRTRELDQQNVLLQKQNQLVKKIFDSSVDAIAVYDKDMRIVTLNQTAVNIFGKSYEDLIGKSLLDIIPQMKNTKGYTDLKLAIDGETIHNKAYYSEITRQYYENFLIPLRDENDAVYAVLVMAHDVTELIGASEKLKEAQQIAQIGHWDWDVLTNRLSWSDNMFNIYGINVTDVINYERFISHVHPDDRTVVNNNINLALQTGDFKDFFHRIITSTGEEKVMHARGEVVKDGNGRVIRMVGTGQDVTQQKLIERELITTSKNIEERNRFIEQLINSSLDLITVIDKDQRVITLNNKAKFIYESFYKQDLIGKKITGIDPPLKGTESFNDLKKAFEGNVIIRDKVKSTISDKYYEHNYIPLTNAVKEVYAVMIISHDITDGMQRMEELRKLYESDEQKNNFIAMASHELKTPITSIKGYVQLLLNALEKEKEKQKPLPPLLVRSSLLSVDKQIKRLTRLISELLDISKIETGTLDLKKEKFSLNELAIETVEDILYTNTKHNINLYHDFHGQVFGDKDRVGQVMINLLTNAIKYSPDNNRIDVTIHKVSEREIGCSVRDYGIGIDKEEQKRIFERFYRSKGKQEQTYPGFGIGLFIANEFIQKHGGYLWVESEKGAGSTFTFTLPIIFS